MASLLVTLAFASLPPGVRPHHLPHPQTAELVRLARDRNRAAIASVRTMTCGFYREYLDWSSQPMGLGPPLLEGGQYWRDGSTERLRRTSSIRPPSNVDTTVEDRLIRGGKYWALRTSPNLQRPWADLSVDSAEPWAGMAVWQHCLFGHMGPKDASFRKYGTLSFSELLDGPYEVVRASRVTEGGRDCIYVELAYIHGRIGFWFASEFNHLVWKTTTWAKAGGWHTERRVTEFARSEDGAFHPVQIQELTYARGELQTAARTVLIAVRINKPIPPDDLRLPNIAGMTCKDYVRWSVYPVDADGNPAGPETPGLRTAGNALTPGVGFPRSADPDPPQPAEESLPDLGPPPQSQEWLVGVALLGAFLVIVVVASYAGRRPRRTV